MHRPTTYIASVFSATTVALASAFWFQQAMAESAKPAATDSVLVYNYSAFNDIPTYINRKLSAAQRQELKAKNLAVVNFTRQMKKKVACYSMTAFVTIPKEGRSFRMPLYFSESHRYEEAVDPKKCQLGVLEQSLKAVVAKDTFDYLVKQALEVETILPNNEPEIPGKISIRTQWHQDASDTKVRILLMASSFASAFDYRQVAVAIHAENIRPRDGHYTCRAFAWLSGPSPSGGALFNYNSSFVELVESKKGETEANCQERAAYGAVSSLLESANWGETGLMKDFHRVQERPISQAEIAHAQKAHYLYLERKRVNAAAEQSKK